jgi:hypothetical protein
MLSAFATEEPLIMSDASVSAFIRTRRLELVSLEEYANPMSTAGLVVRVYAPTRTTSISTSNTRLAKAIASFYVIGTIGLALTFKRNRMAFLRAPRPASGSAARFSGLSGTVPIDLHIGPRRRPAGRTAGKIPSGSTRTNGQDNRVIRPSNRTAGSETVGSKQVGTARKAGRVDNRADNECRWWRPLLLRIRELDFWYRC